VANRPEDLAATLDPQSRRSTKANKKIISA